MASQVDNINYKDMLKYYIESQDGLSHCQIEQMSEAFVKKNISLGDIVTMHNELLLELFPNTNVKYKHSMDFLRKALINYEAASERFTALMKEEETLRSEVAIAATMQKTLLKTAKPNMDDLDIGAISVPAEQMNGDYYQFFEEEDGVLGIAVADVIGKGVPAALFMSMIKYSMDSYSLKSMNPSITLKNINRVVNRNIGSSMFITMFYAQYLPLESKIIYASAGHEPGFYFNAEKNEFKEIETVGLVLGVLPDSTYTQYEQHLSKGDMIILLTDGVTECQLGDRFIDQGELLNIIKKYAHLNAQDHVNKIYENFEQEKYSEFRDDFTLVILKKKV